MLTLTQDATNVIRGLLGDRPGVGLRIFSEDTPSGQLLLRMSISHQPEPTDEVVEQLGCQVFVEKRAAPIIDGRTLDATRNEGEGVEFAFIE